MSSSKLPHTPPAVDWRSEGSSYYSLGRYFRGRFGRRVWKVSVDAGLDCPNRDGTLAVGGCIFCNPAGFSPGRRSAGRSISQSITPSITEQLEQGIRHVGTRHGVDRFVAYLQPATNTYAPPQRLRVLYEEAFARPDVVGLIVGTRPDCVGDEVLDLLAEFSERTWLSVEYGLQTIHDRSLDWLGRAHHYDAFLDAVGRSRRRGLHVGAHVILGLPGETRQDMAATARELTRLEIDSVKIHNLHAVKDTPLERAVTAGEVALAGRDEYVGWVVDFLEELSPRCVVARLSGDAPPEYLVAPQWCLQKAALRQAVEAEFKRRDTWQGRRSQR